MNLATVAIGIDESSSRARISRYELGVYEPPLPTARLIAHATGVPLSYLYCEDAKVTAKLPVRLARCLTGQRRSLPVALVLPLS